MKDYESALKSCGIPVTTSVIVSYYFTPEIIETIIESMKGGDHDVDPLQPEPTESAR